MMTNDDIKIVVNVLSDTQHKTFIERLNSPHIMWQLHPKTCSRDSNISLGQAVHMFFKALKPAQKTSNYFCS